MTPIETQALAEVLFWFVVFLLAVLVGDWLDGKLQNIIYTMTTTKEERDQREKDSA